MPARARCNKLDRTAGMAYLVGAGPGDLQLLTLRAREVLARADLVIYDFLANERILDLAPHAQPIFVGKRAGKAAVSQEEINALLVSAVRAGKHVVRLKGGDPFLFGRGAEEGAALAQAGLPFEIIPGITSALAVPAYAGIPLTERHTSASVAIVTGHEHGEKDISAIDFAALARMGTVVFLMGVKNLRANLSKLMQVGVPSNRPAAIIQWGTRAFQRTVIGTVGDLADKVSQAAIGSPAVTVVGEVVRWREALNWFETKPLFGKRIILTRAKEAGDWADDLEHRGAEVIHLPAIRIAPPQDYTSLDYAITRLAQYHWVVFSSPNGVQAFWQRLREHGKDARALAGCKIAVVGPATGRALAGYGLVADTVPKQYRASYLADAIGKRTLRGKRVLLVRAQEGSVEFLEQAQALGARVDLAIAYRTIPASRPKRFPIDFTQGSPDLVVFASGSAVEGFWSMLRREERQLMRGAPVACIGPVTAAVAEKRGFHVVVLARQSTATSLLEALDEYFLGEENHGSRPT